MEAIDSVIVTGIVHTIVTLTIIGFGIVGPIVVYGNKNR